MNHMYIHNQGWITTGKLERAQTDKMQRLSRTESEVVQTGTVPRRATVSDWTDSAGKSAELDDVMTLPAAVIVYVLDVTLSVVMDISDSYH